MKLECCISDVEVVNLKRPLLRSDGGHLASAGAAALLRLASPDACDGGEVSATLAVSRPVVESLDDGPLLVEVGDGVSELC